MALPLAGLLAPLLGSLRLVTAGAVGAALAEATRSLRDLGNSADQARKGLAELGKQQALSGGTIAEVTRLQAYGIRDVAGAAARLRRNLAEDFEARAVGMRLGIAPTLGRRFGPTNEAQYLVTVVERLRELPALEQRLAAARALGVEEIIPLLQVSEQLWKRFRSDAAIMARIADPASVQAATDLEAAQRRLRSNWQALQTVLGKTALPLAVDLLTRLGDRVAWLAQQVNRLPWLRQGPQDRFRQSVDRFGNTVDQFQRWQQGTYGGGYRAQNAIPPQLRARMFDEAMAANSLRMGAFLL